MILQQNTTKVEQAINQFLEQDAWLANKPFLHNLQAILAGDRNPALTEEDKIHYQLVAELKWLLEQLQSP